MSEAEEITERVEISTNSLIELASKLEDVSNAAWTAAQSLKMIAAAGTKIEEARKLMFSPPKVKNESSKEAQESLDAWLGTIIEEAKHE